MQVDLGCCAGDPAAAVRLSQQLLALGADVTLRSRWTNMNALHYAAYFDVPDLVRVLLKGARPRGEQEGPGWNEMEPWPKKEAGSRGRVPQMCLGEGAAEGRGTWDLWR